MATLHVRNVPEPIYELLRECAEQEGRSIGAQAILLIQSSLVPRMARRQPIPGARATAGSLGRFAPEARVVVARAQEEARAAGAEAVEPVHLLLALVLADGPAASALAEVGLDEASIREHVSTGPGSPRRLPFSPRTKEVLENALRESLALRNDWIGTDHLLLALASEPALAHAGKEGAFRASVTLAFARAGAGGGLSATGDGERRYLAVDLAESSERWTERLNELGSEGWELMQIVEGRAVLRRAG